MLVNILRCMHGTALGRQSRLGGLTPSIPVLLYGSITIILDRTVGPQNYTVPQLPQNMVVMRVS